MYFDVHVEVHVDSGSLQKDYQDIVIGILFLDEYGCGDCWTSGILPEMCVLIRRIRPKNEVPSILTEC